MTFFVKKNAHYAKGYAERKRRRVSRERHKKVPNLIGWDFKKVTTFV